MSNPSPPAAFVRLNKLVQAPAQKVYDAWLDPAQIKRWWMPGEKAVCTNAQVDARVGGSYRIAMGEMAGVGTFVELDPPHRIVMTWNWEGGPPMAVNSQITIELFEIDNPHASDDNPIPRATEIVFTHDRLATAIERSEHTGGWWSVLQALGYHVRGVEPRGAMYGGASAPAS